jgi:hypothetical protein
MDISQILIPFISPLVVHLASPTAEPVEDNRSVPPVIVDTMSITVVFINVQTHVLHAKLERIQMLMFQSALLARLVLDSLQENVSCAKPTVISALTMSAVFARMDFMSLSKEDA